MALGATTRDEIIRLRWREAVKKIEGRDSLLRVRP